MSLYTRLLGLSTPKISIHAFIAAIGEWERGKVTQEDIVEHFGLSGAEETEAVALVAKIVPPREAVSLSNVPAGHTLSNVGNAYDAIAGSQNIGYGYFQTAGISQVIFAVRVNKVGAGTQSWQLWNETDGVEVAVIDDAGGTGQKTLSTTKDFPSPLGPGMKVVRVRVKSTTAADDPVFFAAVVSIRRASVLTALELHEVLLLAEPDGSPYHSEAVVKARLGVA